MMPILLLDEPNLVEIIRDFINSLAPPPSPISTAKQIVELIASILTVIAVIIGAIWTYILFIKTRQRFPSANLAHQITHRKIPGNKVLLRITVTIQNIGKVLLSFDLGETRVNQILPMDLDIMDKIQNGLDPVEEGQVKINWPEAGYREKTWQYSRLEVEPGESDQVPFEFILDSGIEYVIVYSYFRNSLKRSKKRDFWWNWYVQANNRLRAQKKERRERDFGWKVFSVYDFRASLPQTEAKRKPFKKIKRRSK